MTKIKKEEAKLEINDTGKRVLETNDPERIGIELNEAIKKAGPENKPSKEEIEEARKEFEEESKKFSIKIWEIGLKEEVEEINLYINQFIKNRLFWTKNGWMGVLKLDEEIEEAYKVAKASNDPLRIGYQALEFLYYSLSNPGGIGKEAAIDFEAEYEMFTKLFKYVEDTLNVAKDVLKEIQFLQDKWAAMAQGFYLEIEPAKEEIKENDKLSSFNPDAITEKDTEEDTSIK